MGRVKKLLLTVLYPPGAVAAALIPLSAAGLIYTLLPGSADHDAVTYLSYILSSYTLTIICLRVPALYRIAKTIKDENIYLNRYFHDPALRVKLSLYFSMTINTLYGLVQAYLGIINKSIWFYALCAYYILLGVIRFFLLRQVKKSTLCPHPIKEYINYRRCGYALLVMNAALSAIVFYIVRQNRGFKHHYIVTIAIAAYTFYSLILAIVNIIKYRKYKSPVISAAKIISLVSAMVSMLSLETAMLCSFGQDNDQHFRTVMTGVSGSAVCIIILTMAIFMIVHATRKIKQLNEGVSSHGSGKQV